jgi:hypothetical protein
VLFKGSDCVEVPEMDSNYFDTDSNPNATIELALGDLLAAMDAGTSVNSVIRNIAALILIKQ